jgi:ABC-2 type transport system ATP-binding protein
VIEIRDLTFRYPGTTVPALESLSLHVRDGSLFGLLGPNGSGKTTLISILAGTLPCTPGSVTIAGMELTANRRTVQSVCALVPQEYAFYPTLSVLENLAFFADVQPIPLSNRNERVREALAIAGLEGAGDTRAERLSGGMKRRLNIAIGLLNRPRLLLLDEPTVGIDPHSRHFILESIRRINAAGTTVIYTSHYMEEVESLCDDIGILDRGRLIAHDSLSGLLSRTGGARPDLEEFFLSLTSHQLREG